MSDPPLQMRSIHIHFSSTVTETFILRRLLSKSLVKTAEGFWKENDMYIKSVQLPERSDDKADSMIASLVAEGGTIWTTKFESYKKTVSVSLFGNSGQTEVRVQLVLPGALLLSGVVVNLVAGAAVLIAAVVIRPAALTEAARRRPWLTAAAVSCVVGAVAALALNDSGILAAAMALLYGAGSVAYLGLGEAANPA
jgi:hypothetical protein